MGIFFDKYIILAKNIDGVKTYCIGRISDTYSTVPKNYYNIELAPGDDSIPLEKFYKNKWSFVEFKYFISWGRMKKYMEKNYRCQMSNIPIYDPLGK